MNTEPTVTLTPTLLETWLSRARLSWRRATLGLGLALLLLLAGALWLDGVSPAQFFQTHLWRVALLSPSEVLFFIFVYPLTIRARQAVLQAFRPLMGISATELQHLLQADPAVNRRQEWLAVGLGCTIGVLIRLAQTLPFPWLRVYIVLSSGAMWALIALAVHAALSGSRLIAEPRRYALRLNLFDLTFLEPVARESLLGALFFIGGITISLFFTPLQDLLHPVNIAIYSILLIVIVVMFFQTMNGTHRLLVDVKRGELDYVRQQLATTYQQLRTPPAGATADGQAAATLHAWLALEQRLLAVPEWPYNPDTIRNLIVSILVPILSVLARLLWPGFF